MKYASSTLLFAEYIDQKDKNDGANQNDLIKTTIKFLFTNEFVALVYVKEEEMKDPLAKGTTNTTMVYNMLFMCVNLCVYVTMNVICRSITGGSSIYSRDSQFHICDRASEKGLSGHIKFDHIFQLCCIIIKNINKELT